MIRINADEHFTAFSAGCASQGTSGKDVKEDLKKYFFSPLKKYHSILIVREQQIYGFDQYMWEQNRYFARPNDDQYQ